MWIFGHCFEHQKKGVERLVESFHPFFYLKIGFTRGNRAALVNAMGDEV